MPNTDKQASMHHSEKGILSNKHSTNTTHWKMVTGQHKILDSLLEMHLLESPVLKEISKKEHTIQF